MNNVNKSEPAPRRSRLAVASLQLVILAMVLWGAGMCLLFLSDRGVAFLIIIHALSLTALASGTTAVILATVSRTLIGNSEGRLTGAKMADIAFLIGTAQIFLILLTIPNVRPRRAAHPSCLNNLRMIENAKQQWALDNKKSTTDKPMWDDLVGKYLKEIPVCPGQGRYYFLGDVETKPRCRIPDHTLF